MMKNFLMLAIVMLSGCSTIHFDNGSEEDVKNSAEAISTSQWHHNLILGLVEVSDPVVLTNECENAEWTSVTTELSFVNGLASGFVNYFAPVWYPKTVEVACSGAID